jgi:hypothetical protein
VAPAIKVLRCWGLRLKVMTLNSIGAVTAKAVALAYTVQRPHVLASRVLAREG